MLRRALPACVAYERGAASRLGAVASEAGGRRCLLVTTHGGHDRHGAFLTHVLRAAGVEVLAPPVRTPEAASGGVVGGSKSGAFARVQAAEAGSAAAALARSRAMALHAQRLRA